MVAADTPRLPGRGDLVAGVVSAVVCVGIVIALPALSATDPDAASIALPRPTSFAWWAVIAAVVLQGSAIAWSRRVPRVSLVGVATVGALLAWVSSGSAAGVSNLAVILVVFRVVLAVPLARLRWALAAATALVAVASAVNDVLGERVDTGPALLTAIAQSLVVVGAPLLIALLVRSRRDVRDARLAESQARGSQRDAEVEAAVSRERTAMARELHDIAAHHLSGIALMAAVVDRQIDTSPEEAHRGVQQVRAQSTAVLDDLRRLVGLLRDDSDAASFVETFASVPQLVERARAHGSIELDVRASDSHPLGAGIGPLAQLAVYRTIQEALTNASTHAAGAPCSVEIDDRDDAQAVISVTNAAPISNRAPAAETTVTSGGFGLVGMRERAELVGAQLSFGPTPDNGWQVRIAVPREPLTPERNTEGPA